MWKVKARRRMMSAKHSWQDLLRLTAGKDFTIERVRILDSDIALEGEFTPPPLTQLSAADQVFVAAFVRSHGSIKQMEKLFGVSYPTIKNRLNEIGAKLEFIAVEAVPPAEDDTLDRLERGELSTAEAIELIKQQRSRES
jgi:hypothetical protein